MYGVLLLLAAVCAQLTLASGSTLLRSQVQRSAQPLVNVKKLGAPSIELLVSPSSLDPGDSVSVSWDAPPNVVLPLKLYLKGSSDVISSYSWTLPGLSGSGAPVEVPVEAKPGDWVFFVEDSASLLVSYSPNVPVQLLPPQIQLAIDPTIAAGTSPVVLYEFSGTVTLPLTLYARKLGDLLTTLKLPLDAEATRFSIPVPSTLLLLPGQWDFFIEDASDFSSLVHAVEVLPINPNPVATFNATEAIVPLLFSSLVYATAEQMSAWKDTASVCSACPGCAQLGEARSAPIIVTSTDSVNQCLVVQLEAGSATGDAVVIAFRGTSNPWEIVEDVEIAATDYQGCSGDKSAGDACFIHSGFYSAYKNLAANLEAAVASLVPPSARDSTRLLITGHSLGGALATIAAYELSLIGYRVSGVHTFGSPRVGSLMFAQAFDCVVGRGECLYGALAGRVLPLFLLDGANGSAVSAPLPPRLGALPPGAGNMAEPLSGVWRVVSGYDRIAAIPAKTPLLFDYWHVSSYVWLNSSDPEEEYLGTFDANKRMGPEIVNRPMRRSLSALQQSPGANLTRSTPLKAVQDHMTCLYAFRLLPEEWMGAQPLKNCHTGNGFLCGLGSVCGLPSFYVRVHTHLLTHFCASHTEPHPHLFLLTRAGQ